MRSCTGILLLFLVLNNQVLAQDVKKTLPPPSSPSTVKIGDITLFGSIRTRMESWRWFETSGYEDTYTFGHAQFRVGLSQQLGKIGWLVEAEVPILFNTPDNAVAPASQGQLGLGGTYKAAAGTQNASVVFKQGYIQFKSLFGNSKDKLKIGRFEYGDGTEVSPKDAMLAALKQSRINNRLIGTFGFTLTQRSFDGLQYSSDFKKGNITFVGARPTEGVFQLKGNRELDVDFYYGAWTMPFKHKSGESEARFFALHYHDGRRTLKTDNRTAALRAADTDNIRVTTMGTHFIGVKPYSKGKFDYLVWSALQFGGWGNLDHKASAIAVEGGYAFTSGKLAEKLKPWVRGGFFRSTGDSDPADGDHSTFFQILPTPRVYARTPFFNLMNNQDLFGELILKPHKRLSTRFDTHRLWLSSSTDLWYQGGGAFQKNTFGYAGRPTKGNKDLGWLFDISADINIAPRTLFSFYVGAIRGGKVQQAIYPAGQTNPAGRFLFLELTQRF